MNAKRQSSRHKFSASDPCFVPKKAHQRLSYLNKIGIKIEYVIEWHRSVQHSKWMSSGCLQAVFM